MRVNLKNVPKDISQAQQALCGGDSEGLGNPALAVLSGERGRDELGAEEAAVKRQRLLRSSLLLWR